MTSEWQTFFDHHAPEYMNNPFTRNTLAEVDFALEMLNLPPGSLPPGSAILDMGCGTGRHSVELARRGFRLTGVDLSPGMLAQARKVAQAAGVTVEWVQSDATKFTTSKSYDAAICLCEGAFSLLGSQDDPVERDLAILRNVSAALKPGARFILTALNAMRNIRQYTQADVDAGRFDPLTMTEHHAMEYATPEGRESVPVRERSYVPTELTLMFRAVGFSVEHILGGTAGNWGWRPVELDEMEMMVIGRKQ